MYRIAYFGVLMPWLVLANGVQAQTAHEVVGRSGPHRWEFNGVATTPATIGKPDGRLQVKVKNGDTVLFRVASGAHDVIFENAKPEMQQGVWEVVPQSGTLQDLPATGFPHYDRAKAQTTNKRTGDLIRIAIKQLQPGAANGILFACKPHSENATGTNVPMLGMIVLEDHEENHEEESGEPDDALQRFRALPKAETCRLIDFKKAEVHPGIVNDTYVLVVSGIKPCANMQVSLVPLVYVQQPDYWGIEVVGCLPGPICLPATAPYTVAIPLDGIRGTKGIEVIGATSSKKIDVPPKR